jgi:hypothetical protein
MALATASEKRNAAKRLLLSGTDPSVQKKLDKIAAAKAAENTFGAVAEEHLANLEAGGTAASMMSHYRRARARHPHVRDR